MPEETAICDSQDDVGVNAILLESDVRRLQRDLGVRKITIIANSMGAAITRAFLAYATVARPTTLEFVDGVVFLQGAQQGSYIPVAKRYMDETPVLAPIGEAIANGVKDRIGLDLDRPAAEDLTPQSAMYEFVNRAEHVPDRVHYVNVASDIRVRAAVFLFGWRFRAGSLGVGDYVMLPGADDPAATPSEGGARFLAASIGRGRSSTQWVLARDQELVVFRGIPIPYPLAFWDVPESHLAFGTKLREICVATPAGARQLPDALLEAIAALDAEIPSPIAIGFGNMGKGVGCR